MIGEDYIVTVLFTSSLFFFFISVIKYYSNVFSYNIFKKNTDQSILIKIDDNYSKILVKLAFNHIIINNFNTISNNKSIVLQWTHEFRENLIDILNMFDSLHDLLGDSKIKLEQNEKYFSTIDSIRTELISTFFAVLIVTTLAMQYQIVSMGGLAFELIFFGIFLASIIYLSNQYLQQQRIKVIEFSQFLIMKENHLKKIGMDINKLQNMFKIEDIDNLSDLNKSTQSKNKFM